MKQLNDRAETPIEVMFVIMGAIMSLTLCLLVVGPLVDNFMFVITGIDIPLSSWGQSMMDLLPNRFAPWVFIVPGFFALLIMAWGLKTVIKRHQYTKEDEYQTYEYD